MASRFLSPFRGGGLLGGGDPFLQLHREMNRLFDEAMRGTGGVTGAQGAAMAAAPRMDIHDVGDALEISAELPGVTEQDIDLQLDGDMLTLRGEKRQERKDEQAHVVERSYGSFQRSVQLPFAPNPDQVQASFQHGVLKIRLPKQGQQEKTRRIPIGGAQTGGQQIEQGRQTTAAHASAGQQGSPAPSGGQSSGAGMTSGANMTGGQQGSGAHSAREEPTDDGSAIGGSAETAGMASRPGGHGQPGVGGEHAGKGSGQGSGKGEQSASASQMGGAGGTASALGGDAGGLKGQGGMRADDGR